jgi:hypothetical protein
MASTPEPLSSELVHEFVRIAHFDLDGVRAFLADEPQLVNAARDWGGGDWETGLGAAAHVGRRDIAELLLDRGARLDVFAAAMLGRSASSARSSMRFRRRATQKAHMGSR